MGRWLAALSVLAGAACVELPPSEEAAPLASESDLASAEKDAICNSLPEPRRWTPEESRLLLSEVARRAAEMKRSNDELIETRGVGGYAGAQTELAVAIARKDMARAAAILRPKLKPGHDPAEVAATIKATSCIDWVYLLLHAAYTRIGRANEWNAIERCGRAWNGAAQVLQRALIKGGWVSPTLGFVTDDANPPGPPEEVAFHDAFVAAVRGEGEYLGTPVAKTAMLQNFLPSPGSSTRADERMLRRVGRAEVVGFGSFHGGHHAPLVLPAAAVRDELAPADRAERLAWKTAKDRGEPFVVESHDDRDAWDKTNFEVLPLRVVIAKTFTQAVTYATGTILYAPYGDGLLR